MPCLVLDDGDDDGSSQIISLYMYRMLQQTKETEKMPRSSIRSLLVPSSAIFVFSNITTSSVTPKNVFFFLQGFREIDE